MEHPAFPAPQPYLLVTLWLCGLTGITLLICLGCLYASYQSWLSDLRKSLPLAEERSTPGATAPEDDNEEFPDSVQDVRRVMLLPPGLSKSAASSCLRVLLVTDTWKSVNGAANTLAQNANELCKRGYVVVVLHPGLFYNVPFPGYPEVRLSCDVWRVWNLMTAARADTIHIATEGPLGMAAKLYCALRGRKHSSSYHTQFPKYLKIYLRLPEPVGYAVMRTFHSSSSRTLVPTRSVERDLKEQHFKHLTVWSRGVDHIRFNPAKRSDALRSSLGPAPIIMCVSRVGLEKNLEAFCSLRVPGTLVLVGDGPARAQLQARHPHVRFVGYKHGDELAEYHASADVFVFPSRTDTFGIVMLEALASGTPVAAYPVPGPVDVITPGVNGSLSEDLPTAVMAALLCSRDAARATSMAYTWTTCADVFERTLLENVRSNSPHAAYAASKLRECSVAASVSACGGACMVPDRVLVEGPSEGKKEEEDDEDVEPTLAL